MEAKLSTLFLGQEWYGKKLLHSTNHINKLQFSHSHRFFPPSCKIRPRNLSSQSKRQQTKKIDPGRPTKANLQPSGDEELDPENASKTNSPSMHQNLSIDVEILVKSECDDGEEKSVTESTSEEDIATSPQNFDNEVKILDEAEHEDEKEMSSLLNDITSLSVRAEGEEQLSGIQLQDLIGLIRNAEKNIHLLNQARIQALEDLERILGEKEDLQGEINILEMKLAETDARIRVAAQEKIRVGLLEDQLEKLQEELSSRSSHANDIHDVQHFVPLMDNSSDKVLDKDLRLLRTENISLKNDVEALKAELNNIKGTSERVEILEKERSVLAATLKELEFKLAASQEDVSKITSLKSECKSLYEKVEHLQGLLDKTSKQADQAILVLQQNQELQKKVDKLEESLEESNIYKLSSEELQKYNELMQQKIKLLDERLQKSDEEIHSYIHLYQDSVEEFQETLNNLKKETKKRASDQPVNDMPWEFWSQLLLIIDGWFLEKKILEDDAALLREMVWKRDGRICDAYMSSKERGEREIIAAFLRLIKSQTRAGLHVIHIAAEMAPVAKVGGLGDVVTGLGKALQKKGHLVEVVLPKYDCMQQDLVRDLRVLDVVVESYFDGQSFKNKVWTGIVEGLPVYFIEPHHPNRFFWRGQYYGEHDDFKRFSYFSRAALELILQSGKKPDIIHCHDWQTAFVAPLYWDIYAKKGLNSARICFSCHNFEYQGVAAASELASCGLDVNHLNKPDRMQDNFAHDRVNPIKGAIVFSNIVTTVSPTYAQEVRSSEGGKGLHTTLNSHSKKFVGILNGIDTDAWNPATDSLLKVQYNANDMVGKADNKEALRKKLGLSSAGARRALVASVTRLVPQKGVHLIRHAIYRTLELGGQFVLLGSSPVAHIQKEFEDIANHFQNHEHVRLVLKYDESLAHLIYAASDMFIIPSIFEPCGLTQMIAMRYGSIPITRKTGGLNDSVFDVDDDNIPVQIRNGYTFLAADEQAFNGALERAFDHYNNKSESWKQLVQKVMNIDFSWDSSASMYEELYTKAVARARAVKRS